MKLLAVGATLVLLLGAACSDAGDAGGGAADDACPVGAEDCADVPGTLGPAVEPPASGAVPVAQVVGVAVDGPFAIAGYYVDDGVAVQLCEALAESFPPQCGGAALPFDNAAGADLGALQSADGVTWSDEPIEVEGEVVDGVFVAR